MMLLIDRLNQERHKLSSLGSLLLVFFVFSMAQAIKGPAEMLAQEAMELTTTLIEPLLQPPPKTPPPQVKQPEPKPKMLAMPNAPITPAPIEPAREVTAAAESPRPTPTPTPAPSFPTATPVQEAPKMAVQPPVSVSLENNYIVSVRATLNANKRYPTGREASLQRPSGKVKLWFVLARNGALQDAGIDESSNSIILDNAALSTLRRTTYAPWPEGSWASQSQHKFTVTLDFVPLN
ncbi:MAG: TonB family protein [Limnohabitans sp.]|jgi:protein TonB